MCIDQSRYIIHIVFIYIYKIVILYYFFHLLLLNQINNVTFSVILNTLISFGLLQNKKTNQISPNYCIYNL